MGGMERWGIQAMAKSLEGLVMGEKFKWQNT
jgi:hypothetical protein